MPKFINFLFVALKMESCDEMATRLAAGLMSDLANATQEHIIQHLPNIFPQLQAILTDANFDSEAKLVTIIAVGDLVLAAGPSHFFQYLQATQTSFFSASQLSLSQGTSPEENDLLERLRIALCEAYISILHGLFPENTQLTPNQEQ